MMMETFHLTGGDDQILGKYRNKVKCVVGKLKYGTMLARYGINSNMTGSGE